MYHTSTSFGCATKTNERESLESIIKNAEDNMYRNKLLQKKSMHSSVVSSIITALLERSQETEEHALRLFELCKDMGNALNLDSKQQNDLELLSILHDIGKIGMPIEILTKPGKLSELEFNLIKEHPQIGYDILKDIDFPYPIAEIVWQHHEKLDGSGYPRHLKGADIRIEAQIICVADVVEAMATHRPYRAALGIDVALAEVISHKGVLYDADIVDACVRLFREKDFQFQ